MRHGLDGSSFSGQDRSFESGHSSHSGLADLSQQRVSSSGAPERPVAHDSIHACHARRAPPRPSVIHRLAPDPSRHNHALASCSCEAPGHDKPISTRRRRRPRASADGTFTLKYSTGHYNLLLLVAMIGIPQKTATTLLLESSLNSSASSFRCFQTS